MKNLKKAIAIVTCMIIGVGIFPLQKVDAASKTVNVKYKASITTQQNMWGSTLCDYKVYLKIYSDKNYKKHVKTIKIADRPQDKSYAGTRMTHKKTGTVKNLVKGKRYYAYYYVEVTDNDGDILYGVKITDSFKATAAGTKDLKGGTLKEKSMKCYW